ncbi:MAG: magnesium-protoporphyrin monomethyl ester anaerobic oxidative cyclase [Sphingomonas bacterium]|uniref:hypothetical protein n=1 Tax=Sphingomonas bacterium TaxID=1895847 RepID=UPI002614E52A|nr:hypothetical protein [Sphingomonas bacterium]MDB5709276.1 magnesium-protoporphyrin monomethyl ester anaerobic oxidative cyclase [Sphingomonas bacterium]
MRILLINVPHPAIGSRIPKEQLPPLGLLCVGAPQDEEEEASRVLRRARPPVVAALQHFAVSGGATD